MMNIRPFIAYVLLVGLLVACQGSPAPTPTAVPTQLPTPEPTPKAEPATAVPTTMPQPTAAPTPETQVITPTLPITSTTEITPTVGITTTGNITDTGEVTGIVATAEDEQISVTDTIRKQLGMNDENAWSCVFESSPLRICIDNPLSETHQIVSNNPNEPFPPVYEAAIAEIIANIAEEGFWAIDIETGEIKYWSPEELAEVNLNETVFEHLFTADRLLPTLTPRGSGENFYFDSPNRTRQAMYYDVITNETSETGGQWRDQIGVYYDSTRNIIFTVDSNVTVKLNDLGQDSREGGLKSLVEVSSKNLVTMVVVGMRTFFGSVENVESVLNNPSRYDDFIADGFIYSDLLANPLILDVEFVPIADSSSSED